MNKRCETCGYKKPKYYIEGIPFWIIVAIPWFIGVIDIIHKVIS